jgi:hypothetical protein
LAGNASAYDAEAKLGCEGFEIEDRFSLIRGGQIVRTFMVISLALFFSVAFGRATSFGAAAIASTQTVSGGGVTAKVTYLNSKSGEDLRFGVALDTHSVNLDSYDLKTVSVLRDEAGNTYLPTAAENKGSGHHREAIVYFPKLPPETKRIELTIKDVAGVKARTFVWNLE